MKISLNWLKDFVDIKISPSDLAEQVSLKLTEVEGFTDQSQKYDGIICVRIEELKRHPNSDHLWRVLVFDGVGEKHIVCGAQNLAVGQIVPLLTVGNKVPKTGETLKEAVIRGEKSEGMLCSARELDLGEDHSGIFILNDKIKPGTVFSEAFGLDDVVFEIENKALTHRGDCFSHLGIAREISAIAKTPLRERSNSSIRQFVNSSISINIENSKDCARYMAAKVTKVKISPAPEYVQQRLTACGMRPINNIVDFTNYVMLELGQPLHAFDLEKLSSNIGRGTMHRAPTLGVRKAHDDEILTTLDGNTHKLSTDNLVITSNNTPVAVAGVMGGASSEIDETTTEIIIEAANFDHFSIRRSSRTLGVRTEASMRYEKNLDPNLAELGLTRILELIKENGAGECEEIVDEYPSPTKPIKIDISSRFINERIGVEIDPKDVVTILNSLGLTTSQNKKGPEIVFGVTIPTFRKDLTIPEDLIEEIARIYGYQNITPQLPFRTLQPIRLTTSQEEERLVKTTLKELGYHEVYSYSFIGKALAKKAGLDAELMMEIVNPLSPELKYIRNDLFPGLLEKIALNSHYNDHFKLFEVGKELISRGDDNTPVERLTLVGGAYVKPDEDLEGAFRAVKGDLETLFSIVAHINPRIVGAGSPSPLRKLFVADPKLRANFGLKGNLILFKIYLDEVFRARHASPLQGKYDVSTTMPIIEDISFYVELTGKVGPVLEEIKKLSPLIKSVGVFDVYKEKTKKSIAVKITYQDDKTQLSDKEVAPVRNKVLTILTKAGFEVRKS